MVVIAVAGAAVVVAAFEAVVVMVGVETDLPFWSDPIDTHHPIPFCICFTHAPYTTRFQHGQTKKEHPKAAPKKAPTPTPTPVWPRQGPPLYAKHTTRQIVTRARDRLPDEASKPSLAPFLHAKRTTRQIVDRVKDQARQLGLGIVLARFSLQNVQQNKSSPL